jgi:hypothetical protein
MAKKGGQIITAVFILALGFLFLIGGFIESSDGAKVLLYSFGFVFFIVAVVIFIYIFFIASDSYGGFN